MPVTITLQAASDAVMTENNDSAGIPIEDDDFRKVYGLPNMYVATDKSLYEQSSNSTRVYFVRGDETDPGLRWDTIATATQARKTVTIADTSNITISSIVATTYLNHGIDADEGGWGGLSVPVVVQGAIVTTATNHFVFDGMYVTFASTNSTPSINGYRQVVRKISSTKFLIAAPSTITSSGSAGTVTPSRRFIRGSTNGEDNVINALATGNVTNSTHYLHVPPTTTAFQLRCENIEHIADDLASVNPLPSWDTSDGQKANSGTPGQLNNLVISLGMRTEMIRMSGVLVDEGPITASNPRKQILMNIARMQHFKTGRGGKATNWGGVNSGPLNPRAYPCLTIFDSNMGNSTIAYNTANNPTVVTTTTAHGLNTGDVVTISGSNSVTQINGNFTITKVDDNSFTVPANVTTAGSLGYVTGPSNSFSQQIGFQPSNNNLQYRGLIKSFSFRQEGGRPNQWFWTLEFQIIANEHTTLWLAGEGVKKGMLHCNRVRLVRSTTGTRAISGNTVANPTVVTTASDHGLRTGDSVTIFGSNSTPVINGTFTVTVINTTSFSISVNVTSAGTAGTADVSAAYLTPVVSDDFPTYALVEVRSTTDLAFPVKNPAGGFEKGVEMAITNGQRVIVTDSNSVPTVNGEYTIEEVNTPNRTMILKNINHEQNEPNLDVLWTEDSSPSASTDWTEGSNCYLIAYPQNDADEAELKETGITRMFHQEKQPNPASVAAAVRQKRQEEATTVWLDPSGDVWEDDTGLSPFHDPDLLRGDEE
tara:strand:- start:3142 stop:5433 length:2292 start_codon:yes stop_codon:yes gene_type:complete